MVLDLRHPWTDGTTQLVFEPLELLARLTALTPRPRINLLLYYGVLGARSAWRSRLRKCDPEPSAKAPQATPHGESRTAAPSHARTNRLWAELMRRSFGFDVLACPRCGDRLTLIALIGDPRVIRRILSHLRLPTEVPAPRPARSPPLHPKSREDVGAPALPVVQTDPLYDDDVAVP